MEIVAFLFGLCISAVGVGGIFVPPALAWLARQFVASGGSGFYVIATVRIAFGLILISAAPASRAPRALRLLGYVILILGLTTALTGLVAIGRARGAIEWWLQQGAGTFRITAVSVLALGSFVAWVCAPALRGRRPAGPQHTRAC